MPSGSRRLLLQPLWVEESGTVILACFFCELGLGPVSVLHVFSIPYP